MSRGPIETVGQVMVSRAAGVAGDHRGSLKPGRNPRQVSLIEAESWEQAIASLGIDLAWWNRRANLLTRGVSLPREAGALIRIGVDCVIGVTMECDPCSRMEELHPGLRDALMPDWRGGVLGRVIADGEIALGDEIRIG